MFEMRLRRSARTAAVHTLNRFRHAFLRLENRFDHRFEHEDVPMARQIRHGHWIDHLVDLADHEGMRVLEIGSREVTGASKARMLFKNAEYIGFDFYAGPNVDIVGDAHRLSSYFEKGEQFDLIFSSATFEHLAMPWVVSPEIAKLLKVGGFLFVETHFSFSSHERPWHFFQFSDMALRTLFSSALGFQCLEAGVSNPIVGRFSGKADEYLKNRDVTGLYCHTGLLAEKVADVRDFNWNDVILPDVVGATEYPKSSDISRGA